MKIEKGTIVRTILMVIACINLVLKMNGKSPIELTESELLICIDTIIDFAIIVIGFWKNNSFSQNAIKADIYLQGLRNQQMEDLDETNATLL